MSKKRFDLIRHSLVPLAAVALLAGQGTGLAQTIYRSVGPDGKVTYTDKASADVNATSGKSSAASAGAAGNLPFELRQVAARYPVTLYTAANCAPCDSARSFLTGRGIPITEKTVSTNEDIAALQRLFGDSTLPAASIGSQQLKGYLDAEWTQYLDAAGYPKTSALPPSYRNTAATPLVAIQRAPEPAADGSARAAGDGGESNARRTTAPPPPAPPQNTSNPAGIRF
ncbi:MAG: glutaredoxin family protein [Burkholderiaceae bacterium]